jgi:hypothetical protein
MSIEYAKENKQNKLTAKQFMSNAVEEQAEATEDLIAHLMEAHTHQMETLIKTTMEAMKEMLALVEGNNMQAKATNSDSKEKKKKRKDKCNKFRDAPICKHC